MAALQSARGSIGDQDAAYSGGVEVSYFAGDQSSKGGTDTRVRSDVRSAASAGELARVLSTKSRYFGSIQSRMAGPVHGLINRLPWASHIGRATASQTPPPSPPVAHNERPGLAEPMPATSNEATETPATTRSAAETLDSPEPATEQDLAAKSASPEGPPVTVSRDAVAAAVLDTLERFREHEEYESRIQDAVKPPSGSVLALFADIFKRGGVRKSHLVSHNTWKKMLRGNKEVYDVLSEKAKMFFHTHELKHGEIVRNGSGGNAAEIELSQRAAEARMKIMCSAEAINPILRKCEAHSQMETREKPHLNHLPEFLWVLMRSPEFGDNDYTREVIRRLSEDVEKSIHVYEEFEDKVMPIFKTTRDAIRAYYQLSVTLSKMSSSPDQ